MEKKIVVPADMEHLDDVMDTLHDIMAGGNVDENLQLRIDLAVEEMYTNIANYAYRGKVGEASINCALSDNPKEVIIEFTDSGIPYNPLEKDDPDITLKAEDRQIGGLGIFLTKTIMDDVNYEYKDGKNVLTIKKKC